MTSVQDQGPGPFAEERPRLLGLAYRMLGSLSDAEDVVQEAWLRWIASDLDAIERPAAWLTTVTTRLALDRIRTIDRRREEYVGPWLPEPITFERGPEEAAELADSLTLGFLILLDRLGPTERAVFLLADVFGEPYAAIAETVGKSQDACRQIASRARRRLRPGDGGEDGRPTPSPVVPVDRALLDDLVVAVVSGDVARVMALLDPDVVLVSDGGPNRHAARRPVVGAERVTRFLVNLARRVTYVGGIVEVNGAPALLSETAQGPILIALDQRDGRIVAIHSIVNPDKLAALDAHPDLL